MNEEYKMPPLGLFGKRCRIKNVHNMNDGFVYRIVNSGIRSNCWKEPPLGRWGNEPIQHDELEEIVIVVCDTLIDDTSKLERVALKDVEIMEEQKPCEDAISRADILEEIEKLRMSSGVTNQSTWNECVDVILRTIRNKDWFPSVQPTIIKASDIKPDDEWMQENEWDEIYEKEGEA